MSAIRNRSVVLDASRETSAAHPPAAAGPAQTATAYRPDIDGLRAVAVLAVLAFHVAPKRISGGFVGVDVFFVISGYLISSIILAEIQSGGFSYRRFYWRRARRILPSLVLVCVCTLIMGWLLLLPTEFVQLGKHVLAGMLFASNLQLWSEAGYFDVESSLKPLLHLWSLGIEEQFYLIWPTFLVLAARARSPQNKLILAVTLVSFGLCVVVAQYSASAAFYLPFARFWQLAIGAAIATSGPPNVPSSPRLTSSGLDLAASARHAASWIGVILIGLAVAFFDDSTNYPAVRALVPTCAAAMIIAAGSSAHANRVLLSRKPAVYIGLVSYPLYLWHWPLLAYIEIVNPPTSLRSLRLGAAGLACMLAVATFHFLEKRIRSSRTIGWLPLSGAALLCCTLGMVVIAKNGFAIERGPWVVDTMRRAGDREMQNAECLNRYASLFAPRLLRERDFCLYEPRSEGQPVVTVLGDSHANALFMGLREVDKQNNLLNLGRGTCVPLAGFDPLQPDTKQPLLCGQTTNNILNGLSERSSGTVIVHGYFYRAYNGVFAGMSESELETHAKTTFARLKGAYRRVVVVLDVPILNFLPSSCVPRPAVKQFVREPCTVSANVWRRTIAGTNKAIVAAAKSVGSIEVFDPSPVLCDAESCHALRDGKLLYVDAHHLSRDGAELVGHALRSFLWSSPPSAPLIE